MPPRKYEEIIFDFIYGGKTYTYNNGPVINNETDEELFRVDISAYNIERNENNLRIICIVCMSVYGEGLEKGEANFKEKVKSLFKGE